jgi:hypothetical protein
MLIKFKNCGKNVYFNVNEISYIGPHVYWERGVKRKCYVVKLKNGEEHFIDDDPEGIVANWNNTRKAGDQ